MRITLIHAKINYDNMEPFGVLSLGTVLKQAGHDVIVLDFFPDDSEIQFKRIKDFSPQLIGYSIETPGFKRIGEINSHLQNTYPDALFCAGGNHTTALPQETLKELSLDFVVSGEAEISFPAIVNAVENRRPYHSLAGVCMFIKGKFIQNKPPAYIKELDSVPIVDRSLIPDNPFYLQPPGNIRGLLIPRTVNIMTSRGCHSSCVFCDSSTIHGKTFRQRSVKHVIQEIVLLYDKLDLNALFFIDDNFTFDEKWVLEFCREFSSLFPDLKWGCQSRADCLNEPMLQAMKKAGCIQIDIGVESGDPNVLQHLRKGETVKDIIQAAELIHKYDIRLLCSFVIGSPEENWNSIELTKKLIKRIKPSMCQYFTLVPYPGTVLEKRAVQNQWHEKNITFSELFSQKQWKKGILSCGLNPHEQVIAKKKLQRATLIRDYHALVTGWLKHPQYLLFFAKVFINNAFFLSSLFKSISSLNAVSLLHEIYSEYNKFILKRIRTSHS